MRGLHPAMVRMAFSALAVCMFTASLDAALIGYRSRTAFNTAVSNIGHVQTTIDFETDGNGNPIVADEASDPGLVGDPLTWGIMTLTQPLLNVELSVRGDVFDTTSEPNSLGIVGDGAGGTEVRIDEFLDGDRLEIRPTQGISAIGMDIILDDTFNAGFVLADDDIFLEVGASTIGIDADMPIQTFSDGTKAYFLGIVDDTGATFTSADLESVLQTEISIAFVVDNLSHASTPEPGSLALCGLAAIAGAGVHWRRRRKGRV